MAEDLYAVLGVDRGASQEEIRKAYRKLAKELHPDFNPGDRKAEERFKKVSAAYEILGDPEKRARYDRGEIDETGAEKPQQRYYRDFAETGAGERYHTGRGFEDFADLGDIFSELFGRGGRARAGPMRGPDLRYHLVIDFLDAVRGGTKRVVLPDGSALDVRIPAGIESGQVIRLRGKGAPGLEGGPPGDALVEVEVRPHPLFTREGSDIRITLPIAIDEAVLGGKVEVPTVDGPVRMTIPKGASSGRVLRLRGKGVRDPRTGRRGDQYVRLEIVLPETIDSELEDFMRRWRERHAYDPRRRLREVV
ncbi:MAG TPA: J domain-containing protein [Rhodospirillales bacterium]|nr:J domain-containing protein [Rhodospirillales bacterium]